MRVGNNNKDSIRERKIWKKW